MHKWAGIAAAAALALGAAGQAVAAQPSEKQVRELFEVMHMDRMFGQMNTQMVTVMGQAVPCVPASYWQGFIDGDGARAVVDRMVPVFQRHFSAEEIDGLLKFYRSPLGQKVIAEMPATMAEGMQIGRQWGQQRAQEMLGQLQKQGKVDTNDRCPASPAAKASPLTGK